MLFKDVSGGEEDKLAGAGADEGVAHPAKGWGWGGKGREREKDGGEEEDIYTKLNGCDLPFRLVGKDVRETKWPTK